MDLTVLGVLELTSIAAGIKTLDAMVKAAVVRIIDAKTICPGKFYIIITGEVAAVEASLTAGRETAAGYLLDELFLPNLHNQVIPAILGTVETTMWEAVGVLETFSIAAALEAGDIAAKKSDIELPEIRLATGLGGKSYVKMIGKYHNILISMEAAVNHVQEKGLLCNQIIIPQADSDIIPFVL